MRGQQSLHAGDSWITRHYMQIEDAALLVAYFALGAVIFSMNCHTVLIADDFGKVLATSGLHSFPQYLDYFLNFYFTWGGRVWGEVLTQAFLHMPRVIFNILNTVAYLALVFMIFKIILHGAADKKSPFSSLLIFAYVSFMLMFCLPAFGQDMLWITGSANYLWLALIPVCMTLFLQKAQEIDNARMGLPVVFVALPLAFMSGWSSEGFSSGLVFTGCVLTFFAWRTGSGDKRFLCISSAAMLAGMLILWLAPGNFTRAAAEFAVKSNDGSYFSPFSFLKRLWHNFLYLVQPSTCLFPYLIAGISILFGVGAKLGAAKCRFACTLLAASVVSSMSVAVVAEIYSKMYLFSVVPAIAASGIFLDAAMNGNIKAKAFIVVCLVFASRYFIHEAKGGIAEFERTRNEALSIIAEQTKVGNFDVVVMPNKPKNRFCGAFGGLDDIGEDPEQWVNRDIARTYGLKSLRCFSSSEAVRALNSKTGGEGNCK